jgi:hypothetical protein
MQFVFVWKCARMYKSVAYVHTYIRTYIHTCIHTIHTYMHTYIHSGDVLGLSLAIRFDQVLLTRARLC